jgi:hypothetical protein
MLTPATGGDAADLFKVSIRTAHGYANGAAIPEVVAMVLRLLVRGKIKDLK